MENTDKYEFSGFPTEEPEQPESIEEVTLPEAPVDEIPVQKARPASPFADSPYVTYSQPETPVAKQPKKPGSKAGRTVLCAILIVALVAAGCGITALGVNAYWQEKQAQQQAAGLDALAQGAQLLGGSLNKAPEPGSPLDSVLNMGTV